MNAQVNERVAGPFPKQKEKSDIHLVSAHVRDLLNVRRLQGRLTVRQTAALLNCAEHDIPVLVSHRLLTPLDIHRPMHKNISRPLKSSNWREIPNAWGKFVTCCTTIGKPRMPPNPTNKTLRKKAIVMLAQSDCAALELALPDNST